MTPNLIMGKKQSEKTISVNARQIAGLN